MDSNQFDALVQTLGTAGSRRSAVRRLAGMLVAVGLAAPAAGAADADRRHRPGSRCKRRRPCRPGQTTCVVGKRKRKRKRVCVDLQTDPRHCGACNQECADDTFCRRGQCQDGLGGVECGPDNCNGCCNGTTCVSVPDQSNQTCGLDGVTCESCSQAFFCQAGACICLQLGETCDPAAEQNLCCAFGNTRCSPRFSICCLEEGSPCPQPGSNCPQLGRGCCCSGTCDPRTGTCAPSSPPRPAEDRARN